jgi:hypothetical protein
MLNEDGLDADDSSRPAVDDGLLSISYDLHHYAPPPENQVSLSSSNSLEEGRISAEGVYEPKSGIMSMAGCQERSGSTDCQILITVQFAAVGDMARGLGSEGAISSLRDRTDPLFFEKMDITLYGMYSVEVSGAISRMDLESVMVAASATLSCVFAVMQILHAKRRPETALAMSVTMLAVLALGHIAPLALGFEILFVSRRSRYSLYPTEGGWLEPSQAMVRVPALVAFLLHLRLLRLALLGRLRSAGGRSEPAAATPSTVVVSERIVRQVCLPLYLLGGVLAAIVHVVNAGAASGGSPVTLWDDLTSYAGVILDGFLLPQIILNASVPGSRVGAVVSPWFYVGGTVIRAAPHVYDAIRRRIYGELSLRLTQVYASPRGDLFGVAWDIVIPCGAAVLATLLFLQQRTGNSLLLPSQRRARSGYQMVSHT